MKARILTCAAFLLAVAGAFAEEAASLSYSLGGDVDAQAALGVENTASVFSGLSAYRDLSGQGAIDGKLTFSRGYATLGLLDFTFTDADVVSHLNGAGIESLSFLVNELYADVGIGDMLAFRLGKQRLKWGTGFVFNPSDPVNPPKDPTATRAVREGVPALKAELITSWVSAAGFVVLFDALDQAGVGGKISTSALPGTDLSVSGYWSASESWTGALNASVAPFYELPGWDTIQLWVEGAVYGKGRYSGAAPGTIPGAVVMAANSGTQFSVLVGGSAQLPVIRTIVMAEYYHLGEGLDVTQLGGVYAALGSSNPLAVAESSGWYAELMRRPGRLASDYLFLSLNQPSVTDDGNPVLDTIGLQGSCLLDLVDRSFLATAGITTSFVTDSTIGASMSWAQGGATSEFGNMPSRLTAALEMKVYF
jgi:hypothetical protein